MRISENVGRPIGVNTPTPDGSRTVFIAPKAWSQERLSGWVAARHQELEAQFGATTFAPLEAL